MKLLQNRKNHWLGFRLLLIFSVLLASVGIWPSDWKLEKNQNGITVYTREKAGSNLKEFRAMMWVSGAKLSQLVAAVNDVPSYPSWYGSTSQSSILKKNSDTHIVVYIRNKAPWPVADRDMVIDCKISQNKANKAVMISLNNSGMSHPVPSGVVRVPKVSGYWQFTPQANGTIMVYYQLHNEPGGSLPDWLGNKVVVDMPLKTMTNLRQRVTLPQYKDAKVSYIED